MKTFISLLAASLFVSGTAMACPNLAGNYSCTYEDGTTANMSVTQEERNGVTVYLNDGSELIADNQVRPIADEDSFKEGTLRAWCDGEALKLELIGKIYEQGQLFGDVTAEVTMTADATALTQKTTGSLKSVQGTFPLDAVTTCKRVN